MGRSFRFVVSALLMLIVLARRPALAQTPAPAAKAGGGVTNSALDARETVSTILVAGLVGGILGLSTLSFYDRPQDNIRNITIGAATGMIITALSLTFSVASNARGGVAADLTTPQWAPIVDGRSAGVLFSKRF